MAEEDKAIIDELEKLWDKFSQTEIAVKYQSELQKFKEWLSTMGPKLLMARAKEAAGRGNPVARDYTLDYALGMLRRGGERVLVNMFAAYLVERGVASQYYLIKNKLVAGGESIATWLRVLRALQKS
ncbi:MAG: hypothetical protein TU35_005335 [Thermoproteus sp. AZ2]|jgi:aspartokinase|uniref:Uncharacterized protein n=1 Tax=Thermoproteus sp. AZ2 TaxID=1609232 RepID=A0ACC6V0T3_9CREN